MKRPAQAPVSESVTETILTSYLKAGLGLCMSIEQAGELIGVKKTKAAEMANDGTLPTITVGGIRRVSIRQLLEAMGQWEERGRWRR